MYATVAWARVGKFVEISAHLAKTLLKGFIETWGARNVLCVQHRIKKHVELETTTYIGSLSLRFTWWLRGCPWSVGWEWSSVGWLGGLSLVGIFVYIALSYFLRGGVTHPKELYLPSKWMCLHGFQCIWCWLSSMPQKQNKKQDKTKQKQRRRRRLGPSSNHHGWISASPWLIHELLILTQI